MNAAQTHLLIVHAPVVGSVCALILLVGAVARRNDLLLKFACAFLVGCAALSGVAYFSGPPAYELLKAAEPSLEAGYVEQHAVVARAGFIGMIVLGVLGLNVLLRFAQGESPARWLRWTLLVATLGICYVLTWSAHLGGLIRHPEIRQPPLVIFPELPKN